MTHQITIVSRMGLGRGIDSFTVGPAFHRWLPDGESNAISIVVDAGNADVHLWFERYGVVQGALIVIQGGKKEVDPNVMRKQGILDAGPLYLKAVLREVTESQYTAVTSNKEGDEDYVKLAKRVVKHVVDPVLGRLTRLLCDTYGQHWLRRFDGYDSRYGTLGSYCKQLRLQWLDSAGVAHDFQPTEARYTLHNESQTTPFGELLTEADWHDLGQFMADEVEPSFPSTVASRATRLFDEGKVSLALIEAVTALELTLDLAAREMKPDMQKIFRGTKPFAAQVAFAAALFALPPGKVELAIEAIQLRNAVVHEAKAPTVRETRQRFDGLIAVIGGTLSACRSPIKSPLSPDGSNQSRDDWGVLSHERR